MVFHRQRPQHNCVHQAEDRCVRADVERQRQHRRRGEAGIGGRSRISSARSFSNCARRYLRRARRICLSLTLCGRDCTAFTSACRRLTRDRVLSM